MNKIIGFLRRQPPGRLIALGFAAVILLGSVLLIMPFSVQEGVEVRYIDTLYTSTSAVCVTGLIAIDAGDTFTPLGQAILAGLIQVGGLGVTSVGAGIIIAMGKRIDLKGRTLIREASNVDSSSGLVRLVKAILLTTLIFELAGAALSFLVFVQAYPPVRALGISLFHSVAAFNNSGFDILGNFQNLIPYQDDVLLNLVTCALIIFGGIGFLVIQEVVRKRFRWSKFSMHTKVVLTVSAALIVVGTLLIKLTEDVTWLGAFFHSVSARTAGFSTYPLGSFSNAGLLVLTVLMFLYMRYTKHGYEIAVVGDSIGTARYAGMKVNRIILRTVFLSACLIGLAAAFKVGTAGILSTAITDDVGWTGIIVAWLAKLNTGVIFLVSALIGVLQYGSAAAAATFAQVDSSFADMLQGVILFLVLAADFFTRFRVVIAKKEVERHG